MCMCVCVWWCVVGDKNKDREVEKGEGGKQVSTELGRLLSTSQAELRS